MCCPEIRANPMDKHSRGEASRWGHTAGQRDTSSDPSAVLSDYRRSRWHCSLGYFAGDWIHGHP
jgi:hypothetical protein